MRQSSRLRFAITLIVVSAIAADLSGTGKPAQAQQETGHAATDPVSPYKLGLDAALIGRCIADKPDIAAIRSLLEQGADPNLRNTGNPWLLAEVAASPAYRAVLKELIARGANINARGRNGASPLGMAVERGDPEQVTFLLRLGADPNLSANAADAPPLSLARNNIEIARLLIARGAKVDATDHQGQTPLMVAALQGRAKMARFLLDHGADPGRRNTNGETALQLCGRIVKSLETVRVLQSASKISP